jgi:predicted nucleic acid-binding protein
MMNRNAIIAERSIAITLTLRALAATAVIPSQLITEQLEKIVKEKNLLMIATALATQSFIHALVAIIETGLDDRFAPFKI